MVFLQTYTLQGVTRSLEDKMCKLFQVNSDAHCRSPFKLRAVPNKQDKTFVTAENVGMEVNQVENTGHGEH